MNRYTRTIALGLVSALAIGPMSALAQEAEGSFLSDYSGLKAAQDGSVDRIYIAPDALARLGGYKSVMVDQPELALSPDSKYDSMKPDDMKLIADSLRAAITNELKDGYQIVEAPGPGVLYLRAAVGNLYLKKHKRSIFSYTPVGFVVHGAAGMAKEVTEKIDVSKMTIEAEVLDLRVLRPLDDATIMASVRRTRRAIVVDEGWRTGSLAAEIMARIMEQAFYDLDAPLARVCSEEVPIPYAKHLEEAALPSAERVVATVREMAL